MAKKIEIKRDTINSIRDKKTNINLFINDMKGKKIGFLSSMDHLIKSAEQDRQLNVMNSYDKKQNIEDENFDEYEGIENPRELAIRSYDSKRIGDDLVYKASLISLKETMRERINNRKKYDWLFHPFRTRKEDKLDKELSDRIEKANITKAQKDLIKDLQYTNQETPKSVSITEDGNSYFIQRGKQIESNDLELDETKETIKEEFDLEPTLSKVNEPFEKEELSN